MVYLAGRIFQLIGLIAMPSAIWVGHFERNEQGAIAIFVGSMVVFLIGYALSRIGMKLGK